MMKVVLYFLFFFSIPVFGQQFSSLSSKIYPADSFPENLRSSKSVVLIDMPSNDQKEYNRVKEAFHLEISKSGIDAVAYYTTDILFAGYDVLHSFIQDFTRREIENFIFLKFRGDESSLLVTALNESFFYDSVSYPGWKTNGRFREIVKALYVQSSNSGLERTNFLLNTVAEEGPLTRPVKGKIADYFTLALRSNTLAVSRTGNLQRDFLLENALEKHYPFKYELVDKSMNEEQIKEAGYNFVLRYIEAPQILIRQFLDQPTKEGLTHFMAVKRTEDSQNMVPVSLNERTTKFYIKDLKDGDAFIGSEWDIDSQWIDALINHIYSFRERTRI